jgi:hypothetical protein
MLESPCPVYKLHYSFVKKRPMRTFLHVISPDIEMDVPFEIKPGAVEYYFPSGPRIRAPECLW